MIEHRMRIERQVFEGRKQTKQSQEPVIPTQPHSQQQQHQLSTSAASALASRTANGRFLGPTSLAIGSETEPDSSTCCKTGNLH
jgi:hypothetical protein